VKIVPRFKRTTQGTTTLSRNRVTPVQNRARIFFRGSLFAFSESKFEVNFNNTEIKMQAFSATYESEKLLYYTFH